MVGWLNTLKNMAVSRSRVALALCLLLSAAGLASAASPVMYPIGSREVAFGNTLSFAVGAAYSRPDKLIYTCDPLPANAVIDHKTGLFVWTPAISQIGSYSLTFTATVDGQPALYTSEAVPCAVIFRTVRHEKVYGLGVGSGAAIIETRNLMDIFPKLAQLDFDGQTYSPSQRSVSVGSDVKLHAQITSPYNIIKRTVTVLLDGEEVQIPSFSNVQVFGEAKNILSLDFEVALTGLSAGEHTLTIKAANEAGLSSQSIGLSVGGLRLIGSIMPYPSPYRQGSGNLTLQYNLSQDADIDILIFGASIQILKKITIAAGAEGGRQGLNNVVWDGKTDFGTLISNGIYVATVVDRASQTPLGKVKVTVY